MQIAKVIGHAIATAKHPSLIGSRLLVVQPLSSTMQAEGEPLLAVDQLGAAPAQIVLVCLEGRATRMMLGDEHAPVRCCTIGILDQLASEDAACELVK